MLPCLPCLPRSCAEHEDCNDGPSGDGRCECVLGREALCGQASRQRPAHATCEAALALGGVLRASDVGRLRLPFPGLCFDNLALRTLRVDADTRRRPRQESAAWNH